MRPRLFALMLGLTAASVPSSATPQSSAPNQAQIEADLLQQQIRAATSAGNGTSALELIAAYRKTGVGLPPPLTLLEANIAHLAGDNLRSLRSVNEFLAKTGRDDPQYAGAIALLGRVRELALQQDRQRCLAWRKANPIVFPIVNGMSYQLCEGGPSMWVYAGGEVEIGRATACDPASRRCKKRVTVPGKIHRIAPFAVVHHWTSPGSNCELYSVCGADHYRRYLELLSQRSGLVFTLPSAGEAAYFFQCGTPSIQRTPHTKEDGSTYYGNGCVQFSNSTETAYFKLRDDADTYAAIRHDSSAVEFKRGQVANQVWGTVQLQGSMASAPAAAVQP